MLPVPPVEAPHWWRFFLRISRDHYVRIDTNDYSVHPDAIGRTVSVRVTNTRVSVVDGGRVMAAHARCWAHHQTLTDPEHAAAAARMRAHAQTATRRTPPGAVEVQARDLAAYDRAFAVIDGGATDEGWPDAHQDPRDQAGQGPDRRAGLPHPRPQSATLREATPRLADRARAETWSHEEFLVACLQREVAAREAHGGEGRIRAARFPARKSLEDFDYDHQRSASRQVIAHLGTLDFVADRGNVVFLGPPGTGKTHLAIGLGLRACQAGHRVAFATAADWVARLADAHAAGHLPAELTRLGRIPLIVVDEVGYIPFEPEAANLFFQLISARYERASVIVTSNKPFGR
jgi:DNA replication protein DnaC